MCEYTFEHGARAAETGEPLSIRASYVVLTFVLTSSLTSFLFFELGKGWQIFAF